MLPEKLKWKVQGKSFSIGELPAARP
jgi:hypothetical protein